MARLTWDVVSDLADALDDVREKLDEIKFPELHKLDMPSGVRRKMMRQQRAFGAVCSSVFNLHSEIEEIGHDLMGDE